MAREAKVKVSVDVEDAKRSMDQVNEKMTTAKSRGTALSSSIQNVARGAAAGIGVLGGILDQAAGGGVLSAAGSFGLAGAAEGWKGMLQALGVDVGGAGEFAAENRAIDKAVADVSGLVGAGGEISNSQIQRLLDQFTDLYRPGEQNVQRVQQEANKRKGGEVSNSLNDIQAIDHLTDMIAELITTIQNWSPSDLLR